MVNKVNIQIMIDTFKRLRTAPLEDYPDKGFNMYHVGFSSVKKGGYSQHGCGTAACIIGWTHAIIDDFGSAQQSFGMVGMDAEWEALTVPSNIHGTAIYCSISQPEKFTIETAISVLQILRDEGIVDWNRAIENPWSPDEEKAPDLKFNTDDWLRSMVEADFIAPFPLTEKPKVEIE